MRLLAANLMYTRAFAEAWPELENRPGIPAQTSTCYRCRGRKPTLAKPPPPTLEAATQECNDLLHAYRDLRDRDAPLVEFEALQAKVRSARTRAKMRAAEPGFSTLWHQLTDVSEYLKRFKPSGPLPPASADELLAEVAALRTALAAPRSPAQARALTARAKSVQARIDDARARAPDKDADHDAYVDVEEQLWDLGFPSD